jgi:hypothetical protein
MATLHRSDITPGRSVVKEILLNPLFSLPLVSAVSYLVAYMFEASYLAYFEVGHQFVEIPVNIFVLSLGMVSSIIFYVLGPVLLYSVGAKTKTTASTRYFYSRALGIFMAAMMMIAYSIYINTSLWTGLFVLAVGLLATLVGIASKDWPLIVKEFKLHGLRKQFVVSLFHQYRDKGSSQPKPGHLLFSLLTLYTGLIFVVGLASLGIICGRVYAYTRHNFLAITQNDDQYILVRSYSNKLIFSSVDPRGSMTGRIMLLTPQSGQPLIFDHKNISDVHHKTIQFFK